MTILLDKFAGNDDFLFNVRREEILTSSGSLIKGKRAIVNDITNEVVGVVSDKYRVVTNHEVMEHMSFALEASGLDLDGISAEAIVGYGGSRAMVNIVIPAHEIKVKGDVSKLKISVLNSYDGRWKYRSYAGALRMACMNGSVLGKFMGTYSEFHTQKLDVKAGAQKIVDMAENFHKAEDWWNQMLERKVDSERLKRAICIFLTGKSEPENRKEIVLTPIALKIIELFNTYSKEFGANAYALYNALTDYVTHKKYNERTKNGMLLLNEEKISMTLSQSALFAYND